MTKERLLDAAYHLRRQAYSEETHSYAKRELKEQFPEFDDSAIAEAYEQAESLIIAACTWADVCRTEVQIMTERAPFDLAETAPGFSTEVYQHAKIWGLRLTEPR